MMERLAVWLENLIYWLGLHDLMIDYLLWLDELQDWVMSTSGFNWFFGNMHGRDTR